MKLLSVFQKPSAVTLAAQQLEEHKRQLLEAHNAREYANAMCDRHTEAISRLSEYLAAERSPERSADATKSVWKVQA